MSARDRDRAEVAEVLDGFLRRAAEVLEQLFTGQLHVREREADRRGVARPAVGLQALRAGEIDVFVHDAVTAWRVGDNEANDTLTSSFSPLTEEYLAWAVRQTDDALHHDLEAVLERWRHSGRLQELFHKWLTFHVE